MISLMIINQKIYALILNLLRIAICQSCPCSLSSKSHRDTIYNTINSCRRINDKLNEISILHDQKGLNMMNE